MKESKREKRQFSDKSEEELVREFNLAIEPLRERDYINHNYQLNNLMVRTLILLCIQKGNKMKNEMFLDLAGILYSFLLHHEPESRETMERMLWVLDIPVKESPR